MVQSIKDIFIYEIFQKNILFTVRLSDRKLEIFGFEDTVLIEGTFGGFSLLEQEIWANDNEESVSVVFEIIEGRLNRRSLPYVCYFQGTEFIEDQILALFKENGIAFYGIVNRSKEILNRHPFPFGINNVWKALDNQTFISRKENLLCCHAVSDGRHLWCIDVGEKGRWQRLPDEKPFEGSVLDAFVYGTIIVAQLNNYKLLGIDGKTGTVIWEEEKPWYHKWGSANGKLYLLYHSMPDYQRYIIRDMLSGEVEGVFDLSGGALQNEIYLSPPCVHESYFLLTSQKDPKIFILDLHTGKLLKTIKIENARGVPYEKPKALGNRIYQLDIDNVLHVFDLDFTALHMH